MIERYTNSSDLWSDQNSHEMTTGIASSSRNCLAKRFRFLARPSPRSFQQQEQMNSQLYYVSPNKQRMAAASVSTSGNSYSQASSSIAGASGNVGVPHHRMYQLPSNEWSQSRATNEMGRMRSESTNGYYLGRSTTPGSSSMYASTSTDASNYVSESHYGQSSYSATTSDSESEHYSDRSASRRTRSTNSAYSMSSRGQTPSPVDFAPIVKGNSRDLAYLLTPPPPSDRSARKRREYERERRKQAYQTPPVDEDQVLGEQTASIDDNELEPEGQRGQTASEIIKNLQEALDEKKQSADSADGFRAYQHAVDNRSRMTPSPVERTTIEVSLREPRKTTHTSKNYILQRSESKTSSVLTPMIPASRSSFSSSSSQPIPQVAAPQVHTQQAPTPWHPRPGDVLNPPNMASNTSQSNMTYGQVILNKKEIKYLNLVGVFEGILQTQVQRHGELHPSVAHAYQNLGMVHAKHASTLEEWGDSGFQPTEEEQKQIEDRQRKLRATALSCFQASARITRDIEGALHPSVAVAMVRIGLMLLESGQYENAIVTFKEALRIRLAVYGTTHRLVANLWNNMGLCSVYMGKFQEAKQYFEAALEIQRSLVASASSRKQAAGSTADGKELNEELLELADTLFNLGGLFLEWIRQKGFQSKLATAAEDAFIEALKNRIQVMGPDDDMVLQVKSLLDMARMTPKPPTKSRTGDLSHSSGTSTLTGFTGESSIDSFEEREIHQPNTHGGKNVRIDISQRMVSYQTDDSSQETPSYYNQGLSGQRVARVEPKRRIVPNETRGSQQRVDSRDDQDDRELAHTADRMRSYATNASSYYADDDGAKSLATTDSLSVDQNARMQPRATTPQAGCKALPGLFDIDEDPFPKKNPNKHDGDETLDGGASLLQAFASLGSGYNPPETPMQDKPKQRQQQQRQPDPPDRRRDPTPRSRQGSNVSPLTFQSFSTSTDDSKESSEENMRGRANARPPIPRNVADDQRRNQHALRTQMTDAQMAIRKARSSLSKASSSSSLGGQIARTSQIGQKILQLQSPRQTSNSSSNQMAGSTSPQRIASSSPSVGHSGIIRPPSVANSPMSASIATRKSTAGDFVTSSHGTLKTLMKPQQEEAPAVNRGRAYHKLVQLLEGAKDKQTTRQGQASPASGSFQRPSPVLQSPVYAQSGNFRVSAIGPPASSSPYGKAYHL